MTQEQRLQRIVFEDSTEIEMCIVYGSAFHVSPYTMRNDRTIYLHWHSDMNVFYPKSMSLERVRRICGF